MLSNTVECKENINISLKRFLLKFKSRNEFAIILNSTRGIRITYVKCNWICFSKFRRIGSPEKKWLQTMHLPSDDLANIIHLAALSGVLGGQNQGAEGRRQLSCTYGCCWLVMHLAYANAVDLTF